MGNTPINSSEERLASEGESTECGKVTKKPKTTVHNPLTTNKTKKKQNPLTSAIGLFF